MKLRTLRCAVALSIVFSSALSLAQTSSAAERFQSLREKIREARRAQDWKANLAAAHELEQLLNRSPESLLETARAEVHLGDLPAAARQLEAVARMGQYSEAVATSPEFAALRQDAHSAALLESLKANRAPVAHGAEVFRLADAELLAEDVDYDASARQFLITSVRQRKIIAVDESGAARDFAASPDGWPMMALKIDAPRGLVWTSEVAVTGFAFAPKLDWGRSALLCFSLSSGKLLRRVEGPRPSALGDLALTPAGDVIASDGDGGGIYRLAVNAERLERIDHGDFLSPQTPAMHPDGRHLFVPDYTRGIAIMELATGQVQWLAMADKYALNGVDGLYFANGKLLATQNGTTPERVAAFQLDAALGAVVSAAVLERATPTLGDPTHGVVVGEWFYYIANSGWDVLDDEGHVKPGAHPSPPRLMRVRLR